MKDDEKAVRWNELRKNVCTNTAQFWATDFVSELIKVHSDVQRRYSIHIPLLNMRVVLPEFHAAKRRLYVMPRQIQKICSWYVLQGCLTNSL